MTTRIHTNGNYTNVGMLEVVNEPLQGSSLTRSMISEYYPKAYSTIRAAEDAAKVAVSDRLTVQMMASSNVPAYIHILYILTLCRLASTEHSAERLSVKWP